jgi:hypothetical protein
MIFMNRFLPILAIVLMSSIYSCSQKKNTSTQETGIPVPEADTTKNISIHFIGDVEFRKSYAHIPSMEDEKEAAKEGQRVDESNPVSLDEDKISIRSTLEKFGFVKGTELLLNKFRFTRKEQNELSDSSGKVVRITIDHSIGDKMEDDYWSMRAFHEKDSANTKIDAHLMELKYALLDIIPGGYKEIVFLYEWYIANGYNYDLLVYEVKTK